MSIFLPLPCRGASTAAAAAAVEQLDGGGGEVAAVANTADWYQHLHLGMNSLMLMESMIRAGQAVGGAVTAVLSAWPGGLLCRITITLCPWWSLSNFYSNL